jgi:hypothetical protein
LRRLLLQRLIKPGSVTKKTNETSQDTMRNTEKNDLRRYQLIFLLPVVVIIFLAACQKPSITFGTSFISNNNTNVVVIDTSTVLLSTVLVDSFPTAATGSMLLGSYHDNYFGNITARSFLEMGTPAGTSAIDNMTGFDSIELIMRLNKSFYGDTTVQQRYYVSQLTSVIQYSYTSINAQTTFYNTSSFPFNPEPLGHTDIFISPTAVHTTQDAIDSVKIRLADTLGQNLLALIVRKSDTITNLNSFVGYFKGLTIYSDTTAAHSGTMYGFKDTVTMRLFYHHPGVFTTYSFLDFKFINKQYQFNHITADRSGSPLAILNTLQPSRPNPLIPVEAQSALTANASYVQSATGIQAKIRFPFINNILTIPDYIGLLRAELILKPIVGTFSPELLLPPQMILSQTDQNNEIGGTLVSVGGIEYGNLIVDYTYGQNTSYSYDVTNYIKQQLTIGGINNNGLMLSLPAPANHTIFNRVVFGDVTNKNYNITLKLYYISLPH